jgi:hypothetical protein
VLHLCLLCMVQLIGLVGRDAAPHNQALLRSLGVGVGNKFNITGSEVSSSGSDAQKDSTPTSSLLTDLMSRVNRSGVSTDNTTSEVRDPKDLPVAFPSMAAFQQWRVGLLQRIETHLVSAHRFVIPVGVKLHLLISYYLFQRVFENSHSETKSENRSQLVYVVANIFSLPRSSM